MVRYFWKRLLHRFASRRAWVFLILGPSLLYLAIAASRADRFTLTQNVAIHAGAPIALSHSPVGFGRLSDFVAQPVEFFSDRFAVREMHTQLHPGSSPEHALPQLDMLARTIMETMSLTVPSDGVARLSYEGEDPALGAKLVAFYAHRLLRKNEEGLKRATQPSARAASSAGAAVDAAGALKGTMDTTSHRALWRPERLLPLVALFAASCFLVLLWISVLESIDSSFKSERQVARYLGMPVLGPLPDLHRISRALEGSASA